MAQDRPTEFPEWASDPPAGPPTTITEPSEPTKQEGFQPGNPRREYMNWLLNLAWQWLVWLDSVTLRVMNIFFPDQAFAGSAGDLPGTGAGLGPIAAADFTARVIADGFMVGPVDGPEFTYAASKDTYWDLGRDGTWTAVVVNNGAGEPAVTALSTRCFKVVTDATDRTAVTDYRLTYPRIDRVFDFGQIRLGEYFRGSAANLNLARIFARYKGGTSTGYTLIAEFTNDSGSLIGDRMYVRHDGGQLLVVRGASYDDAANTWIKDAGASLATMESLGYRKEYHEINWSVESSPLADASWYAASTAANGIIKRFDIGAGVRAGGSLSNSDYEKSSVFRFIAQIFGGGQREAAFDALSLKVYALPDDTHGTEGAGNGGELVANASWDEDAEEWVKRDTAVSAAKLDLTGNAGLSLWGHLSGDTWADAEAGGDWTKLFGVDLDGNMAGLAPQILCAAGKVITDGAGDFTSTNGFGYTASLVGGGTTLRITLDRTNFASGDSFYPSVSFTGLGFIGVSAQEFGGAYYFDVSLVDTDGTTVLRFDNAVRKVMFNVSGNI